MCATFAVTKEQKEEARRKLEAINDPGEEPTYSNIPGVPLDDDIVTVIYGDEYQSLASSLVDLLRQAAEKMVIKNLSHDNYN
jgi:hypothetical protein